MPEQQQQLQPLGRDGQKRQQGGAVGGCGGEVMLECAYHGWQFDGAGSCVRLPQMLPEGYREEAAATAAAGRSGGDGAAAAPATGASPRRPPRACSGRAYPTAVAQGMVWVWYGGFGADGGSGADESLIPLDFAEQGTRRGEQWALVDVFTRDFPYDWETMILDSGPAGISGRFRGVRAAPPSSPGSPPSFSPGAWSDLSFAPPCLVSMRFRLPGKGEAGLVLYCVPLGRGRSRMIARLPRNFATGWLAGLQPRWAKHLPRMAVLDQDIDLLREQEEAMTRARLREREQELAASRAAADGTGDRGRGSDAASAPAADAADASATECDWRRRYVMPAPADRFVVAFRRWLESAGPSRPWALPAAVSAAPETLTREQVLDRYHSHVKGCSACSRALDAFTRLASAARVAAGAALAAAAGLAAAAAALPAVAGAQAAASTPGASAAASAAAAVTAASAAAGGVLQAAALAAALAAACWAAALAAQRVAERFHYTEEGRELRMNEDRRLRRLLFTGTNSFNSMVALTNKRKP
ncbi:hypothetical protein GPECTOR_55g327 [Gonium pectorale]|uniref:Rieske domain-containing protein n=1 Tax=Gonium pectorale TaxID=33097 RepID=A0A150G6H1_GONPE|nr:hypothetical protein GPECTOR_55g327 [Gonium pectorale]|eukprot:KXZ45421.1 hypothetical protein GPECTOR_55g327 [Gonium pectorale]